MTLAAATEFCESSSLTARLLSIDILFYLKPAAYCTAERWCIQILELEKFWSNVFLIQKNSGEVT